MRALRALHWLRGFAVDLVDHVRLFGVVTVLALLIAALALLDNHFDFVQSARVTRRVDSLATLLTTGRCVWYAPAAETNKRHDTVPLPYPGPRR